MAKPCVGINSSNCVNTGGCTIVSVLLYSSANSIMAEIRSKWVDEKVHTKMNMTCEDRFYKDVQCVWYRSSLFKSEATVVVYKRWKRDGRWEECMEESERV